MSVKPAVKRLLKTKTGLARAAIRHFLNNQILDCYFQALLLDQATINKYYDAHALIRDPDQAEVVKAALQGVGSLAFTFNTNAPMLDMWSQNTLELAGLVAPKHNKQVNSSPLSGGGAVPISPMGNSELNF